MKLVKIGSILFIAFLFSCGGNDAPQTPLPQIEVFEITSEDVPLYHDFVGTIAGQKDIAIRARVNGFLEGIHFNEGFLVKKGELLYTIESQQYEAESAEAQSRLAEAQTRLAKAEADLNRIRPLAENNAVSQSELDAAVASYDAAQASVQAAEANLRATNIQLGYTKVKAPISGLIGKTKAKVGDFVGQSPNPVILNVVSLIDTILVDFFLTENQYLTFVKKAKDNDDKSLKEKDPELKNARASLELILSDGSVHPHKGYIKFIDREIDPMTGAILIQASFPNPDEILRPGQFAIVRIRTDVVEDGILIPQRCVSELQGRYSVFVVNSDNVVERREINASSKIGSMWLINKGLDIGEKVIYEGLQKVRPGMTVNPVLVNIKNTEKK